MGWCEMAYLEPGSHRRTAQRDAGRVWLGDTALRALVVLSVLLALLVPASPGSVNPVQADDPNPQGCVDIGSGAVTGQAGVSAEGSSGSQATGAGSAVATSGSVTVAQGAQIPEDSEEGSTQPGSPAPVSTCDAACRQAAVAASRVAAATSCLSGNPLACIRLAGLTGRGRTGVLGAAALAAGCALGADMSAIGISCGGQPGTDTLVRRRRWRWIYWTRTITWQDVAYLPCTPVRVNGRLEISCDRDEILRWVLGSRCQMRLDVPPVPVYRDPFPRGIVTQPNTLRISPEPRQVEAWCAPPLDFYAQPYMLGRADHFTCSADEHAHGGVCGGDVRGYTFGFRWVRETPGSGGPLGPVEKACWDWGDRKGGGCDTEDVHTYPAASNTGNTDLKGLLIKANGPRPVPNINLATVQDWSQESYQASIPTFWTLWFNIKYSIAVVDFDPVYGPTPNPTGPRPITGWTPRVSWKSFEYGWTVVDLRHLAVPTYYFRSYRQYECQDTTKGSLVFKGPICQQPPPDPAEIGFLPVNVIDVQNVLLPPAEAPNQVRPDR